MIIVYNSNIDDYTNKKNNIPIYRGTIFGNPFTHDGKKSSLAKKSFATREEAIEAYKLYFNKMLEVDEEFKAAFDSLYEKYKNGEDIYLQCFCKPLSCHGDFIASELQRRLIMDKIKERKKMLNLNA